jgi:hypothetical protein
LSLELISGDQMTELSALTFEPSAFSIQL